MPCRSRVPGAWTGVPERIMDKLVDELTLVRRRQRGAAPDRSPAGDEGRRRHRRLPGDPRARGRLDPHARRAGRAGAAMRLHRIAGVVALAAIVTTIWSCAPGPMMKPDFNEAWLVPDNVLQRWHEDKARLGPDVRGQPVLAARDGIPGARIEGSRCRAPRVAIRSRTSAGIRRMTRPRGSGR